MKYRLILATISTIAASAVHAGDARFTSPTNEVELTQRIADLREAYAPYLRSLPEKLPDQKRTKLPAAWKFVYEAKLSPKDPGIPPAPAWQRVDFDDSKWETS